MFFGDKMTGIADGKFSVLTVGFSVEARVILRHWKTHKSHRSKCGKIRWQKWHRINVCKTNKKIETPQKGSFRTLSGPILL